MTAQKWWWDYDYKPVDWKGVGSAAWFVVENCVRIMNGERPQAPPQQASPQPESTDLAIALTPEEAANVLGVDLDAPPDDIRAALRAKMTTGRVHPDHGGDERVAKRFIAARNLLMERARITS